MLPVINSVRPILVSYAADDRASRGRRHVEPHPGYRNEFQRDRDRIIHSSAFRRLEYKTQVFVNHEGDLFRTRLTHSLEVAQIARSIARILGLHEDLTEAISLAHDLGHTPFGHAGQDALNQCMQNYGGFEHNLQSLRVVDQLEEKYAGFDGLNLTFETREGILKHCSKANAKQLGDVGERFLNRTQPTLEAQLANLADEIAYNNHDVDDGCRSGLITVEQLESVTLFQDACSEVKQLYPELKRRRLVHEIIRRIINRQVIDLIKTTLHNIEQLDPQSVDDIRQADRLMVGFSEPMLKLHLELKQFLNKNLYQHFRVHRMTNKARQIIDRAFTAFMQDRRLLPTAYQEKIAQQPGETHQARIIADYIAGMTDRYAIAENDRLFNPKVNL